ncbi:helicase HerA domain-containing protein [Micromonospora carbonacea]|uniref:helicase HerA domain-containing protein n=1 Tax=Micromonospora carbonacea TaxID=47853 RepID=UPI003D96F27B
MDEAERTALAALRFDWAPVPDDVWRPLPFHVEGLHVPVVREVLAGVDEAASNPHGSPLGLVVQGQRGSGKTHLLGVVRQRVQEAGGYFFLVGLLDAGSFWDNVLAALLDGLARPVPGSPETQLKLLLRRLSALVGAPRTARRAVMGDTELTRPALDAFLTGLGDYDRHAARTCQETARALALAASEDISHRDLAENYFLSGEEVVAGERAAWGMRRAPRPAQQIVQDLSWLLALTGPSVVAIDQVDTLIAQLAIESDPAVVGAAAMSPAQSLMLARMADGLMSLRQATRRTLTVLACIPNSWTIIRSTAADTVADRFRETPVLRRIDDADLARAIIEKRFSVRYGEVGYAPPYPSWPVSPRAFAEAGAFTPRQLLIEIDRHIRGCLAADEVREMTTLGEPAAAEPRAPRPAAPVTATAEEMDRYDARFAELRAAADVAAPLGRATEDEAMPPLLAAGLTAWILERGDAGAAFSVDPPPSTDPPLHARLRLTLDERTEDQAHWCFRAISDDHHGNAALARLRKASVAAALDTGSAKRTLFLLRNRGWSTSAATRKAVAAFTAAGGQTIGVGEEDLRILSALRVMLAEATMDFQGWLADRRPTRDLKFLQHALADVDRWTTDAEPPPGPAAGPATPIPNGPIPTVAAPTVAAQATPAQAAPAQGTPVQAAPAQATPVQAAPAPAAAVPAEPAFVVGYGYADDAPVPLALEALRKHTTIFAGSGSGKTVLIRRIVEECALAGVSAIVLDPNNDLARLGEEWPEPPAGWRPGDAARAKDYLAYTDVVVWTPRRNSGRPLSFQPLPDFTGVRDDPDEFGEAVEAAVAALAPRAMVTGRATRAHLGLAVLRKAVEHYGRRGGSRLKGLVDTLTDLPDGIIDLDDADKIGLSLAQNLTAAMVNDPLFGGEGTPMDPGVLLTPAPGRRARVSVVSLVGLPSDDVRQSFVNQLQMALFAWIKRNPAGDRPLLGLLVMDEAQTFAPSGAMTACTQSTLALAAQARKYGLGLVFATQAPKGLHNRIPGNAATQLYGLMNSPIQIEAAREMARAKGGDVPDISRLTVGEFYLAAEGAAPRKIRTPLSLTHHPRSPLTVEEVLGRARARAGSGVAGR